MCCDISEKILFSMILLHAAILSHCHTVILLYCHTAMMQGDCCASYAFSAVGTVEGMEALASGELKTLSEQNIIDCSGIYICRRGMDTLRTYTVIYITYVHLYQLHSGEVHVENTVNILLVS